MTYLEKIIDISTGEETFRNYTTKEVKEIEDAIKANQEQADAQAAADAIKASAKQAVLDKLGLTAEEIAALLG
jgi:hypothetical protein